LLLGILYVKFRTIWISILGHAAFNLMQVLAGFLSESGSEATSADTAEGAWVFLAIGAIVFAVSGCFLLRRASKTKTIAELTSAEE